MRHYFGVRQQDFLDVAPDRVITETDSVKGPFVAYLVTKRSKLIKNPVVMTSLRALYLGKLVRARDSQNPGVETFPQFRMSVENDLHCTGRTATIGIYVDPFDSMVRAHSHVRHQTPPSKLSTILMSLEAALVDQPIGLLRAERRCFLDRLG
ncbi:hypothetical protein QZM97_12935 [Burkholderia orbicola]|uniref:Uncharacterized protein n=1 Tax=Burkholderia orbicola TaxID=2978683 RepID=A0ABT8NSQ7_9BURK|nr:MULTISPECIES: hypothetical protein [Burkholderia cepacia complex]MDN7524622.1 hypothetical protein [Burkholderia orbicola]MDN7775514.1 hypothetical protein [Burkholderia orbicola]MDN7990993.1 hypothetical protein [Burkholderia orbicola]